MELWKIAPICDTSPYFLACPSNVLAVVFPGVSAKSSKFDSALNNCFSYSFSNEARRSTAGPTPANIAALLATTAIAKSNAANFLIVLTPQTMSFSYYTTEPRNRKFNFIDKICYSLWKIVSK